MMRRGTGRWRPDPAVPLLALLPWLVFAAEATGRRAFAAHDIQYYFYPYHAAAARIIAGGHPPLWNPYPFAGLPLLGDGQTALLYPSNWLFLLPGLPTIVALTWAILLQFSIAAVGTYGLARSWGLDRAPAIVAAVAYALGGFPVARIVHLSILAGAAMLPVVLLALDLALRDGPRRPRAVALAALAVALQLVAGHPQVPVYTALAAGLLVAARAIGGAITDRAWWPLLWTPLRAAGAYALGAALAAAQLLPWAELATRSPRAAGATFAFVFERSKVGADWLLLLFPYLFGALRDGPYGDAAGIAAEIRVWEQAAYVGIPTLALATLALAGLVVPAPPRPCASAPPRPRTSAPPRLFAPALLLVGIALAAGLNTPVADYTYATPVLGQLRDQERAAVLVALALASLAGLGTQRLLDAGPALAGRGWRLGLALAAWALVVAPLAVLRLAQRPELPPTLLERGITPDTLRLLRPDRANALVPLALAGAGAALLLAWGWLGQTPLARQRLAWATAALVLLDLAPFAAAFHATTDPAVFARVPPLVEFLRADPGPYRVAVFLTGNALDERAAQDRLAVGWAMAYGIEEINGFNSLQTRRYTDYLFGPDRADVSYGTLRDERLLAADSPILAALNVRYLIVPRDSRPLPQPGPPFRPVWEDATVRVYRNDRAAPRAFLVPAARPAPDDAATLRAVTAPGFDPVGPALVAGDAPALPAAPLAPGETVALTSRDPDRLTLAVAAARPRLLVLSELDYPGWRATIDGRPAPIYRTNYLFRGIVVPPGDYRVELIYRPASVGWGLAVSILALLIVVGLLALDRRCPSAQ